MISSGVDHCLAGEGKKTKPEPKPLLILCFNLCLGLDYVNSNQKLLDGEHRFILLLITFFSQVTDTEIQGEPGKLLACSLPPTAKMPWLIHLD